jgi:hypothetical protein
MKGFFLLFVLGWLTIGMGVSVWYFGLEKGDRDLEFLVGKGRRRYS